MKVAGHVCELSPIPGNLQPSRCSHLRVSTLTGANVSNSVVPIADESIPACSEPVAATAEASGSYRHPKAVLKGSGQVIVPGQPTPNSRGVASLLSIFEDPSQLPTQTCSLQTLQTNKQEQNCAGVLIDSPPGLREDLPPSPPFDSKLPSLPPTHTSQAVSGHPESYMQPKAVLKGSRQVILPGKTTPDSRGAASLLSLFEDPCHLPNQTRCLQSPQANKKEQDCDGVSFDSPGLTEDLPPSPSFDSKLPPSPPVHTSQVERKRSSLHQQQLPASKCSKVVAPSRAPSGSKGRGFLIGLFEDPSASLAQDSSTPHGQEAVSCHPESFMQPKAVLKGSQQVIAPGKTTPDSRGAASLLSLFEDPCHHQNQTCSLQSPQTNKKEQDCDGVSFDSPPGLTEDLPSSPPFDSKLPPSPPAHTSQVERKSSSLQQKQFPTPKCSKKVVAPSRAPSGSKGTGFLIGLFEDPSTTLAQDSSTPHDQEADNKGRLCHKALPESPLGVWLPPTPPIGPSFLDSSQANLSYLSLSDKKVTRRSHHTQKAKLGMNSLLRIFEKPSTSCSAAKPPTLRTGLMKGKCIQQLFEKPSASPSSVADFPLNLKENPRAAACQMKIKKRTLSSPSFLSQRQPLSELEEVGVESDEETKDNLVVEAATSKKERIWETADLESIDQGTINKEPLKSASLRRVFSNSKVQSIITSSKSKEGEKQTFCERDWIFRRHVTLSPYKKKQKALNTEAQPGLDRSFYKRENQTVAGFDTPKTGHTQIARTTLFFLVLGVMVSAINYMIDEAIFRSLWLRNYLQKEFKDEFSEMTIYVAYCIVLTITAIAITNKLSPAAQGSGIPEIKHILSCEEVHTSTGEVMSVKTLIAKVLGIMCAIGSGLSIGREGPFVHISNAVASLLIKYIPYFEPFYCNDSIMRQVFAAACAVGISSAYGAPIGGVLFSIEITTNYYLLSNYYKGFVAAVAGYVLVQFIHGMRSGEKGYPSFMNGISNQPDYTFISYKQFELPMFALLGVFVGLLGPLYVHYCSLVKRAFHQICDQSASMRSYLLGFIISLVTGAVFFISGPFNQANYFLSISDLISPDKLNPSIWGANPCSAIAVFLVSRTILTPLNNSLNLPAGDFCPIFAVGAACGRFFGTGLVSVGLSKLSIGGYALCGAAGLVGATTHTISSAIIALEISRLYSFQLPVLITVLVANGISKHFGPGIYDRAMNQKGFHFLPRLNHFSSLKLVAKDVMERELAFLLYKTNTVTIISLLKRTEFQWYPVITSKKEKRLLGCVSRKDLLTHLLDVFHQHQLEWALFNELPDEYSAAVKSAAATFRNPAAWLDTGNLRRRVPSIEQSQENKATVFSVKECEKTKKLSEGKKIQKLFLQETNLTESCIVDQSPIPVNETTPLEHMHVLFEKLRIKRLFVVSSGQLVGVITREILTKALLLHDHPRFLCAGKQFALFQRNVQQEIYKRKHVSFSTNRERKITEEFVYDSATTNEPDDSSGVELINI